MAAPAPKRSRARRILRGAVWAVLGTLLGVTLLVLAVLALLFTPPGQKRLQAFALQKANESIRGHLELGKLDLRMGGWLRLDGVRLLDPEGRVVASADRIQVHIDPLALVRHRIWLKDVELDKPELRILAYANGETNLTDAIAPRQPKPKQPEEPAGTPWKIELDQLALHQGLVDRRTGSTDPKALHIEGIEVGGHAIDVPGDVRVALEAHAQVTSPEKSPLEIQIQAQGTGTTLQDQLDLKRLHIAAGRSTVDATGQIAKRKAQGHLDAHLTRALGEALGAPLAGDVFAHADASWEGDTATLDARFPDEGGAARLHATVKPDAKPLAYAGTLELKKFDPGDFVTSSPHMDLNGRVALDGHGTTPQALVADLQIRMTESKIRQTRIQAFDVDARVEHETLDFAHLRALLPGTEVTGEGTASRERVEALLETKIHNLAELTATLGAMPPYVGAAEGVVHLSGSPQAPKLEVALESPRVVNPAIDFDLHDLHVEATMPDVRKPTILSANVATSHGHFKDKFEITAFAGQVQLDGRHFGADFHSTGPTQLRLRTTGELPDPHKILTLATLDLGLGEVAWTLSGPARFDLDRGIRVDRADLASGEQHLILKGGLLRDRLDALVEIHGLDLSKLPRLLVPERLGLQGRIEGIAQARGNKSDPRIEAHLELHDVANAAIAKRQARVNAVADASLVHRRARAHLTGGLGKNQLTLDLDAPLPEGSPASAPLSGRLRADGLDLESLAALTQAPPRTLRGTADVDATLSGTLAKPLGRASVALHDFRAQKSPPINGTAKLELGERALLTLDFDAKKGRLTGRAELPLPTDPLRHPERLAKLRTTAGNVDVTLDGLDLDLWRMQFGIPPDADGVITARLRARGTAKDPQGTLTFEVRRLAYGAYKNLDGRAELSANERDVTARGDLGLKGQHVARLEGRFGEALSTLIQKPDSLGTVPVELRLEGALADLATAQGDNPRAHGKVAFHAALTGTPNVPELHVKLEGNGLAFSTVPLGDALAQLDYASGHTTVRTTMPHFELAARADQDLGLEAIRSGLQPREIPIDATLRADKFDLASLSGLTPSARSLGGLLSANASATGTVGDPGIRGTVDLEKGKATVTGFGDYRDVTLHLAADNRNVKLSQLEVHSGDGVAKLQASATRAGDTGPFALTGELHANRFPVENDDQTVAYVQADAKIRGELASANSLVEIHFDQVHADIPTLSRKPVQKLAANPDIVILGVTKKNVAREARTPRPKRQAPGSVAMDTAPASAPTPNPGPGHKIRIGVFAPSNFWLRGQDINVDVRAAIGLLISDSADTPLQIIPPPGRNEPSYVEVVRGKLEVFGRRFDVPDNKPARVVFEGGAPENANLDAAVVYNDRADQIVVTVSITGPVTKPNPPQLTSQPPMDPSQLALLIATGHLQAKRGAGQVSATSQAGSVVGSFLAGQLQNTLSKTLPIDTVSVETNSQGEIRAEVGKYITDKIYVGYTRNFVSQVNPGSLEYQDENINEFTLQYRLSRHWQLEAVGGEAQSGVDVIWQKDY